MSALWGFVMRYLIGNKGILLLYSLSCELFGFLMGEGTFLCGAILLWRAFLVIHFFFA